MRNLLITLAPVLVWFLAITEAITAYVYIKNAKKTLNVLASLVCIGLAIDAAIIASGTIIGEGVFLKSISQLRYVLHGTLVPLLIPIAFYSYGLKSKLFKTIIWLVTIDIWMSIKLFMVTFFDGKWIEGNKVICDRIMIRCTTQIEEDYYDI